MSVVSYNLAPDAIQSSSNYTAPVNLSDITDDPDSPDSNFLIATGTGVTTVVKCSFPTPGGTLSTSASQLINIWVRRHTGSAAGVYPTATLKVYENGTLRYTHTTVPNVSSDTGQKISWTFASSYLQNNTGADCEIEITLTKAGSGKNTASAELGALEWVAYCAGFQAQSGRFAGTGSNTTPSRHIAMPGVVDSRSLGYFNMRKSVCEAYFHADDANGVTQYGASRPTGWTDDSGQGRNLDTVITNSPYRELNVGMSSEYCFRLPPYYSGSTYQYGLYRATTWDWYYQPYLFLVVYNITAADSLSTTYQPVCPFPYWPWSKVNIIFGGETYPTYNYPFHGFNVGTCSIFMEVGTAEGRFRATAGNILLNGRSFYNGKQINAYRFFVPAGYANYYTITNQLGQSGGVSGLNNTILVSEWGLWDIAGWEKKDWMRLQWQLAAKYGITLSET